VPTVDVRTREGGTVGSLPLDDALFGIQPHVPVLHQVVTAQLAAARRGTQSTLTRAEVSGGGAKPFRQKGTGRARQGSTRAPHWAGGGIALGPKPRSYKQRTPKKMIRLALASALSDRAADGRVLVVDEWGFDEPRTKDALAALEVLGLEGKVMLVVAADDETTIKSFRNIGRVQLVTNTELNAYDVLCNDWLVFTQALLPGATGDLDPSTAKAAPVKPAPAPRKATPARVAPAKAAPASVDEEAATAGEAPGTTDEDLSDDADDVVDKADDVVDEADDAVPAADDVVDEADDAVDEADDVSDAEDDEALDVEDATDDDATDDDDDDDDDDDEEDV
jgi:large subunit ribosomal protein L4